MSQSLCANLNGIVRVPYCCIGVPLYAVRVVFDEAAVVGRPLEFTWWRKMFRNVRNRGMLVSAPVLMLRRTLVVRVGCASISVDANAAILLVPCDTTSSNRASNLMWTFCICTALM